MQYRTAENERDRNYGGIGVRNLVGEGKGALNQEEPDEGCTAREKTSGGSERIQPATEGPPRRWARGRRRTKKQPREKG